MTREMVCPYCKHRIYTDAPDPIYCGPHRASVGPNEYPRVQMIEKERLLSAGHDKSEVKS